jgi:hypothetical protein
MWQFSEAFMEACVEENICAFLGKNLRRISRQPFFNGFRPDLVFEEEHGMPVIVELQQHALDRYHLYKTLEYRDHWQVVIGQQPKIILICAKIDDQYIPLAKTHSVDLVPIPRDRFIEIAVRNCQASVTAALLHPNRSETSAPDLVPRRPPRLDFEPIGWGEHQTPIVYLRHVYSELARLHITLEQIPRDWYRRIISDIEAFVEDGIIRSLRTVCDLANWNVQRLLFKDGWQLRKPQIEIIPAITAKRNLSVLWYPKGREVLSTETDWCHFREHSYGWDRPPNELMFVRNISDLDPGTERQSDWDDRVNWPVLDEIFIGLIRTAFIQLKEVLSSVCDVTLIADFEFDCQVESNEWDTRHRITGWRIYNIEKRRREENEQWLASFDKKYGLSPTDFIAVCIEAKRVPRRAAHNFARHLVNDLNKRGIKMTPNTATGAYDRLREFHWLWPEQESLPSEQSHLTPP